MADIPTTYLDSFGLGTRWTGNEITYSFPTVTSQWAYTGEPDDRRYALFNEKQASAFTQAIAVWGDVLDVDFALVIEPNQEGQIRVAFTGMETAAGWAYYPSASNQPIAGDIWIDSDSINSTFAKGSYEFRVLVHEIGHAIGLGHPDTLPAGKDSMLHSIMSTSDSRLNQSLIVEAKTDPFGTLSWETRTVYTPMPMLFDIAAAQALYGANTSTRAGDTVYTWSDGMVFHQSIWDAGGVDTLDASSQSNASIINLNAGTFSSIGHYTAEEYLQSLSAKYASHAGYIQGTLRDFITTYGDRFYTGDNNLSIAYGVEIENALGGNGDDTLIGNALDNVLVGGKGSDQIDGQSGSDTAVYDGLLSDYQIDKVADQIFVNSLLTDEGIDQLTNIEWLAFADGVISTSEALGLTVSDTVAAPINRSQEIDTPLEGNSNHINYFYLEIDSPFSTDISASYVTRAMSAQAGQDYIHTSGVVSISAGQTSAVVGIEIVADKVVEAMEEFALVLFNPVNVSFGSANAELVITRSISDDDVLYLPSAGEDNYWSNAVTRKGEISYTGTDQWGQEINDTVTLVGAAPQDDQPFWSAG